jgi:SpoVK/Ycf46/Vps4 family AAA+-type ATPase
VVINTILSGNFIQKTLPLMKIYKHAEKVMDNKLILSLVDAALTCDSNNAQMLVRKLASKIRDSDNALYIKISAKIESNVLRKVSTSSKALPVDADSRQALVKIEEVVYEAQTPIHSNENEDLLEQVLMERRYYDELLSEGIFPTKSIIFQGPPGVGKTMSARWLAYKLQLPLLTLDLASVMSSFLGKTGSNVKAVLDYAISFPCVLLLDEFDAIAKKRDDDRELGELKRLVTVLLQAIDQWPATSLLIAATNHGDLLDPAIWRRFDMEIAFSLPTENMIANYLAENWAGDQLIKKYSADDFKKMSFSNIDRKLRHIKRQNILSTITLRNLVGSSNVPITNSIGKDEKRRLVVNLHERGLSQRAIAEKLGISRPTVKKALEQNEHG